MLFSIITYFLFVHGCMPSDVNTAGMQPSPLYRYWIHAHEEDGQSGYKVYRPSTYSFPPARGRDGFEIKEKGIIVSHPIAAADGNGTVQEKWKLSKNGRELTITGSTVRRFRIVSLGREKLTLKPL